MQCVNIIDVCIAVDFQCICRTCVIGCAYGNSSQESEEKRRQEAELARLQQDRGEGEEVSLGTGGRVGREVGRDRQVELRLRGDEESEDSDDGPEARESEGEATSFQNFLQQQQKDT